MAEPNSHGGHMTGSVYGGNETLSIRTGVDIRKLWNLTHSLATKNISTIGNFHNQESNGIQFFDTYFSTSRFAVETLFASFAAIFNLLALAVVRRANRNNQSYSAYNTLFINLACANVFACMLAWLTNNILFLFKHQIVKLMVEGTSVCKVFLYLLAAVYVSCSFEIVSVLTMLGFTIVQYYAICRPLYHMAIIRKQKIYIFIACSWSLTVLIAMVPFDALVIVTAKRDCDENLLHYIISTTVLGANISICGVALMYVIIISICVRIYLEIRLLEQRLSHFRFVNDVQGQRKAFITTVILLISLSVFFLPYTTMFIVTLNNDNSTYIHNNVVIYYMNILPYLKFMSDPIIYGLRMREVQELCLRVGVRCGCVRCLCCTKCDVMDPPASPTVTLSMHHMNSFTM